jgi:hypothetical protein
MVKMARPSDDAVNTATPQHVHDTQQNANKTDISHVERVVSGPDEKGEHINYDRIDDELAKYAGTVAVEISEEENKRLKRLIDRRVLPIMVFTYFLQALDKGTMSFASIMGLRNDIPVLAQNSKVCTQQMYNEHSD